jgi:hypothetical protein
MSDDIKNFREAVAKFDELQLELSDLKEALEINFKNYKNVSDISSDIADKNQSVLESINTLQINAENAVNDAITKAKNLKEEMSKYYSAEYSQTKKDFDLLLSGINSSISSLKSSIKLDIQTAVNNASIDTSALSKIINEKIDGIDLTSLDNFTKSVNEYVVTNNGKFENATQALDTSASTLNTAVKNIDTSTKKLNTDIRKINWLNYSMVALVSLGIGLVIGGGGMFFKAFDLVDYAYKEDYKKSLQELEIKKASAMEVSELAKFLIDNEIEIHFRYFSDTKMPYLQIDKDDTMVNKYKEQDSRCYVTNTGKTIIRLDESKTIGLNIPKD